MEIEYIAGKSLTSGRTPQDERKLSVGRGLFAKVIIYNQCMFFVVPEIFAYGASGIGCNILKRRRLARCSRNHYSMFHSSIMFKGLYHARNARPFLTYGNIDANDVAALLVDDRIKSNRSLSCLAVTDDQFPLSPSNRDHRINCLYSCLERLPDRLPVNNTRRNNVDNSACLRIDRPLAVNRLPDSIYNPSDHFLSDRNRHDLAGPFDNVAFLNVGVLAEQDRSNHVFFKVKRHAEDIIGELEKF